MNSELKSLAESKSPTKVPKNLSKQGINLPTYRAHCELWKEIAKWQIKQLEEK